MNVNERRNKHSLVISRPRTHVFVARDRPSNASIHHADTPHSAALATAAAAAAANMARRAPNLASTFNRPVIDPGDVESGSSVCIRVHGRHSREIAGIALATAAGHCFRDAFAHRGGRRTCRGHIASVDLRFTRDEASYFLLLLWMSSDPGLYGVTLFF